MPKTKKCRRCKNDLPIENFVDVSGQANPRGQFCLACHRERVAEWHESALDEERTHIRKLKIVYGDLWRHYASPEEFQTSLDDERDFCPYCGIKFSDVIPDKFTQKQINLDHMDPLDKGGEHSIRNVTYCCAPCNIKKRKRSFVDWMTSLPPEFMKLSRAIYEEKHGHPPEEFVEGCNMGRGSYDLEFVIGQTEEELKKQFPEPKVNAPPSNQPIVIKIDVMKAIDNLPEVLKERLKQIPDQ